jgi:hypothetical protein
MLAPTGNDHFGRWVRTAGDVNGDGYTDLLVGAEAALSSNGEVAVYLGSATGLAASPAVTLSGSDTNGSFGWSVDGAGDVNADGFSDVIVGAPHANTSTGIAYAFMGSGTGLSMTSTTSLSGPSGSNGQFGSPVAGAGDVNGDGFADVLIGAQYVASNAGAMFLYPGGASGLSSTPTPRVDGLDGGNSYFGCSLASATGVATPHGRDPSGRRHTVLAQRAASTCCVAHRRATTPRLAPTHDFGAI